MTKEFLESISKIEQLHAGIDQLLQREEIADKFSGDRTGRWFIEELKSTETYNIGIASSDEEGLTAFPLHRHPDSKEYLICVKGNILLYIEGNIRILAEGDCACLPKGVVHYSKPLKGKAELIYVCIPYDKTFNRETNNG